MRGLLLFIAATAHANPLARPTGSVEQRGIDCKAVNAVVGIMKVLGGPASTFCRGYLHIPATATKTATVAPPAVTVATSTVTVEVIQSECPAKRGLGLLEDGSRTLEQRGNDCPPALRPFPASKISSACSCLSLGPKATTTRTITPPATTVNVVATTTSCITCAPNGRECTFDRPDLCCGRACLRVLPSIPGGPEATCISF